MESCAVQPIYFMPRNLLKFCDKIPCSRDTLDFYWKDLLLEEPYTTVGENVVPWVNF